MTIDKKHFLNYSILIPYILLSVFGLVMVYSATSANQVFLGKSPATPVLKQAAYWLASLIGIWFVYRLRLDFLKKRKNLTIVWAIEFLLLVATLIFGRSDLGNGATGWLYIGPLSIQAAEYLKLFVVWQLSYTFSARQHLIAAEDIGALTNIPRHLGDWRLILATMILLVIFQPDLGNATIITLTALLMLSLSGIAHRWFRVIFGAIFGFSTLVIGFIALVGVKTVENIPIFGHVAKRFSAFFNPFNDLSGAGHQLAHSYYAMSNGGWFGRGLGNSIEKNGYLPEAQSDFIFSIIIEELGLIGAIVILIIVFFLILNIFRVGLKAKKTFNALFAMGVAAMLLTQVFINVGGISGIIPSTGVTFPFFSQGGNNLLTISLAIGIVLNIDASEKREVYYEKA